MRRAISPARRMVLIIDDGVTAKVLYPVSPPDDNAATVAGMLCANRPRPRAPRHRGTADDGFRLTRPRCSCRYGKF
jgi:hypothetical protein